MPDPAPPAAADLECFGLDGDSEAWIDRFREALAEPAPFDAGAVLIGGYRVLAEVGRGGQGVVYRARAADADESSTTVAIKRLAAGAFATDAMRHRLAREAEAAAALDHPGVVRLLEVHTGAAGRDPFLVMEWVDGRPITHWARLPGPQRRPLRELIDMMVSVCDAVRHAHQRGVIHRDLKPSNILVDASGRARVLDFGLAKLIDTPGRASHNHPITQTDQFLGTLAYAAPEQVTGGPAATNVRVDVYALGVVLYQLITERVPFPTAASLAQMIHAIAVCSPERPSLLRPGVSAELDAVVHKALAKDPAQRYQSVEVLADDLRRYLAGDPVEARTQGSLFRLWTFVRRHRAPVAAAAVGLFLVLAFATAATVFAVRAERSLQHEAAARRDEQRAITFLRETLSSAQPGRLGADASILDVLARAAERIDAELADAPAAAAEVRYTIGYTYRTLWRFREGADQLEKALALARAAHGEQSESAARCLAALGACLANLNDERSIAVEQEALHIRQGAPKPDPCLVAEAHMRLGYALYRAASPPNWAEAEEHLNTALSLYLTHSGPSHPDTASCLHNLGYMRWRQGRIDDAIVLYERAISAFRVTDSRNNPSYVELLTGYTSLLERAGRFDDSLAASGELLPLLVDHHGEAQAARHLLDRARVLRRLDRRSDARAACRDSFAFSVRNWSRQSPQSAPALTRFAAEIESDPLDERRVLDLLESLNPTLKCEVHDAARRVAAIRCASERGGADHPACGLLQLLRTEPDSPAP